MKRVPESSQKTSNVALKAAIEQARSGSKTTLTGNAYASEPYVTTNYSTIKQQAARDITQEEIDQQKKVLAALEATSKHLTVETDIITILERIAESIVNSLGVKKVNFWDFNEEKDAVYIIAAYGMQDQYIANSRDNPMPLGEAWIGRTMQTGQAWSTSDVQKDPLLPESWLPAAEKQDYHGLLCLPLLQGNEIIGGMCLYHRDIHKWNYFEYEIMTIVANQASTALTNARVISELKQEQMKTGSIVSSLSDGLILYDEHDCLQLINPRAKELLELQDETLVGVCIEETMAATNTALENLLTIKQVSIHEYTSKEIEIHTSKALVLDVTRVPVRDDEGTKTGELQVLRDMTEQREIEQMKSNFVSVASHQIRTPLTGIRWTIDTLRNDSVGALNDTQRSMLDKASVVTEHFSTLINDLLDVSRIDEGSTEITFDILSIMPIIEKVIHNLTPAATARSVTINYHPPKDDDKHVKLDVSKIDIAIQNLIDNAVKYSPDNTGCVDVRLTFTDNKLTLLVRDNGIGVPAGQEKFLFNKFFRADNAVRTVPNGSGLGLYITKKIIELHCGSIEFTRNEAGGADFLMTLPLAESTQ